MTSPRPWQVTRAACGDSGGLHVQGQNHYTGESFSWHISHYGILWSFRERYCFRDAEWGPGARKRLASLIRLARRYKNT